MNYLFQEKQRIKNNLVKLLVIAVGIAFSFDLFEKIRDGIAVGIDWIPILFVLFIYSCIFFPFLETRIDTSGIYVRFYPIQPFFRFISWESVSKCYILQYDPYREYRSRGYVKGIFGEAYHMSGNMGLQLYIGEKKKDILIGTQKAEELKSF